jgi:DNA-binding MarR family transcriptional regulator
MKESQLHELGRGVKRLQNRHHRALDAALAEIGSTLAQWDALRAIGQNLGASSHALAELTFQTDQSFGALAAKLVERRLASRAQGEGRALRYGLTDEGKKNLVAGTAIARRVLEESFAPLTPAERAMFHALVRRLLRE